jgi:voltage-gated potassium channel
MATREGSYRRFLGPLCLLLGTIVIGTAGYMAIEGWSLSDALFMVVTSIATVGYGEVQPLSNGGRLFTMGLIFVGLGSIYYLFGTGVGFI